MNKTLPDIFKDTRNVNTTQGATLGSSGMVLEFTLVNTVIRNRASPETSGSKNKMVLIYSVFHMQNDLR